MVIIGSAKFVFVLLIFVDDPEIVKVPDDMFVVDATKLLVLLLIVELPEETDRFAVVIVTFGENSSSVPEEELFVMRKSDELLKRVPFEPMLTAVFEGTLMELDATRLMFEKANVELFEVPEIRRLPLEVLLTIFEGPNVMGISVGTKMLDDAMRLILEELTFTLCGELMLMLLLEEEEEILIPEVVPLMD